MSLPESFIRSLQQVKGFDENAFVKAHEHAASLTSIRINPAKQSLLPALFFDDKVGWNEQGFYLRERPSFTSDPLFHAGAYYVQEASSMFLAQALQQTTDCAQPIKVLDLCAAPGGKSTLVQSLITDEALLVSNEVIKTRVNILTENITKWGSANVIVTNNDPKDFQRLQNYFDVIVVDAPCSGSGLFRKDAAAIDEWSVNNVQLCSQRQQRILADIMPSLKENGILIYSTCSYSQEEDEAVVDWLMQQFKVESLPLKVDDQWGIVQTISENEKGYGYRFYPDKVKGEGFFIAAFKKIQADTDYPSSKNNRSSTEKVSKNEIDVISPWLKDPDRFFYIKQNDELIALPLHLQEEWPLVQANLYIKKAGVRLGTVIRNELIPHHELAVSTIISNSIPAYEADLEMALQYLRKQDVKTVTTVKGWALIKYNGLALGWIKALPNRINNYYPKEWRILNK